MFQHGVPRETGMYNNTRDRDSNRDAIIMEIFENVGY